MSRVVTGIQYLLNKYVKKMTDLSKGHMHQSRVDVGKLQPDFCFYK